jgi:tRNA-guanine family transglycosylase
MGAFVNFCAGASFDDLPGKGVDAILFNVPGAFATDKRKCDTQRLMEKSQARFVMLDSGGFQLLNAEKAEKEISFDATRPLKNSIKLINLTPEHVVQAASELQPDILVALDFPIDTISNPKEQEEEFKRKFVYNVKWARKTAELRQQVCPRIALFIPLQAYRIGQVDRFLESIQDVGFDGISMPVRNLSLSALSLFLTRLYQAGIKHVHLLGVAAFFKLAVAAYMARHFFAWLSVDSTSWKAKARHNEYADPDDLSAHYLKSKGIIDGSISNNCPCPWCKGNSFTYIHHLPYSDRALLLKCHNYWVLNKAMADLYDNAATVVDLIGYLESKSSRAKDIEQLYRALSVVDALRDTEIGLIEDLLR